MVSSRSCLIIIITIIIIIIIIIIIHSQYFPRFWLAKGTRIIHHNQLLMTKFGRILCLTRGNDAKNAAFLEVKVPLTEKTWGRGWVALVVKTKNGFLLL